MTTCDESFLSCVRALKRGENLDEFTMRGVASCILDGHTTDEQNMYFLKYLSAKGETDQELLTLLDVMIKKASRISPNVRCPIIDVCGTGGDMQQTFNISTAASFIVASAATDGKCAVAKHGNHSTTGVSGSADIFASLGYDNNAEPSHVQRILEKNHICFIFAQKFHPAMKHIASARKMLGGQRTAFNVLGPLANPASVSRQLVGVSSKDLLHRIPRILLKRGAECVITVMSNEGMDELSTVSSNMLVVADRYDGSRRMTEMIVKPEDVNLHRSDIADIKVSDASESVACVVGAIDGTASRSVIETAIFNAAGALLTIGDVADDLTYAVDMCKESVASGAASKKLDEFVRDAGDMTRLEAIREHGK